MNYIYAPSYPSIRLICYLIQQGQNVTIISANTDIIKLCSTMDWPFIAFYHEVENRPRVRECWNAIKVLQFKRNLQGLFEKISAQCKYGQFYYTIDGIDILGLDIITRFATQRRDLNVTYWCDDRHEPGKAIYPINFRTYVDKAYCNLLYKPTFRYVQYIDGVQLLVQENFRARFKINELVVPGIFDMDVYRGIYKNAIHSACLILGGYSLKSESEVYVIEDLQDIYSFIKSLCPDVYYKPHPGTKVIDSFFDVYNIYTAHVPSDFLFGSVGIAIGAATTAMTHLARMGVRCISVLDMIRVQEGFMKQDWKEKMLKDSDHMILFPQSKEELRCYLT